MTEGVIAIIGFFLFMSPYFVVLSWYAFVDRRIGEPERNNFIAKTWRKLKIPTP